MLRQAHHRVIELIAVIELAAVIELVVVIELVEMANIGFDRLSHRCFDRLSKQKVIRLIQMKNTKQ